MKTIKTIQTSIDRILKSKPDPLNIRKSTANVVKKSYFVSIKPDKIKNLSQVLKKRIRNHQLLTDTQFGIHQEFSQRIFIQDAINFCFWAKKGKHKWTVEYPKGTIRDGWFALTACFDRAIAEGIPLLNSHFLEQIRLADVKHIFRSSNQTQIPFLDQRLFFLREAGKILNQRFGGAFDNLVKEADNNAVKIVKKLVDHFPSFNYFSHFEKKRINFLKRAQICAYDLSLLSGLKIKNIASLTIFADYKLPQIFRSLGILNYKRSLAKRVDSLSLVGKNSREEIEIRAATIWVGELLAKQLNIAPALVDNAIWYLANKTKREMSPYHRTLTTNY